MVSLSQIWDQIIDSSILWIINILLTLYVIYNGRKNPRSTIIWIMVVNVFPFIGFIFFFILGKDTKKKKMFSLKKENDDILEDLTEIQYKNLSMQDYSYRDPEIKKYGSLIKMNLMTDNSYFTEDNNVKFFYWGRDKFEALLRDIKQAKKSIDMQYYIFKTDELGKQVIEALEEKAREGVEVRLIIDGFGGRLAKRKYFRSLQYNGGKVLAFFPLTLGLLNPRINYRNHRKIVIIDDKIAYIGGFNVGDEYVGRYKRFGPWRDTHVRISGGAILGLKIRFLKDWYYTAGEEPKLEEDLNIGIIAGGESSVQVVSSGPDTDAQNIKNAMLHIINSASKELYIQTPYLVPDQAMMDCFKMALLRGVDVNIMIPAIADHMVVHWCTMSFAGELAKLGAKIYCYEGGFIHAKVMFADDLVSTTGTTNLDERSFSLNFETNLVMYDRNINDELRRQFYVDVIDSKFMSVESFNNRPLYMKIREPIARIFAPIF